MKHLKIHQLLLMAAVLFFYLENASAQYKEFKLNANGDTLNAITQAGVKQGKWVIKVDALRGEPGFVEEGYFKAGAREGVWRRYTPEGDLLAVENYKKGGKHGFQQYFTFIGEPLREENWRGYDPDSPYDTVAVYGTGSNEIVEFRIVKAVQYSVKQGVWRYYDPNTGEVVKTEQWERNNLLNPQDTNPSVVQKSEYKKPEKTAEMMEWDLKNKGKKGAIRDGRTGIN